MASYDDDDKVYNDGKGKKVHPPRVTLYEKTIQQMADMADQRNCNVSQVYQDACDFYLNARLFMQVVERFIP